MKPLTLIAFCILVGTSHAQWKTETYAMNGGWNAIYLHGDATHATPAEHFAAGDAANILEVWRWNPNPNQVQFTTSPQITTPGTPEWTVWKRDGSETKLTQLTGNSAYLVRCNGNAATSYAVDIVQRPLPPSTTWVRAGANLLGFPAAGSPLFSDYFATFPAAIAANSKIFKYPGGDFGPANPIQVFNPNTEPLDRNKAYWFESAVVGNFYAPVEISLSNLNGLSFGRTGSVVTARLRNRTAATATVTLTQPPMTTPTPDGQPPIAATVPLTRGELVGLDWVYSPITGANNTVAIGPQASVELKFGIDRSHASVSSAPAGANFASVLRLTDSGNLMAVDLPATAQKSSLAGLWAGDIIIDQVGARATATATVSGGAVTAITVDDQGFAYPSNTLVTVPTTTGLEVGDSVSGPGITGAATVRKIINATQLEISLGIADGTADLNYNSSILRSTTALPVTTVTVPTTIGLEPGTSVTGPGVDTTVLHVIDDSRLLITDPAPDATAEFTYTLGQRSSTSSTSADQVSLVTLPDTSDLVIRGSLLTSDGAGFNAYVNSVIDATHAVIGDRNSPPFNSRIADGAYTFAYYRPEGSLVSGGRAGSATTISATTVTVPTTAGLQTGDLVSGPGITGSAYIVDILGATSFLLSQNIPDATADLTYSRVAPSTTSSSLATIVTVPSTTALDPGTPVTGPGITGTATVARVIDSTRFILSQTIADATNTLNYGTTEKTATADTNIVTTVTVPSTAALSGAGNGQIVLSTSTDAFLHNRSYPILSTVDATHFTFGGDSGANEPAPDGSYGIIYRSTDNTTNFGTVTSTVLNTTTTIAVADTSDLSPGMAVTGPAITGSATVASITDATHFELSQPIPVGTRSLKFATTTLSSASRTPAPNTVTLATTAGLGAGDAVTGPGISGTATVASITNGTELVLSQPLPPGSRDLAYGGTVLTSVIDGPPLPTITIDAPPGGGTQATAEAIISNGSLTGFNITNPGSNYTGAPFVNIASPSPSSVPRNFPLRTLIHVDNAATARLLSQVFVGTLADPGNPDGLCTKESGLKTNDKANALRFAVAHLPLDRVLDGQADALELAGTGTVALGSTLQRSLVVPFDDPTNPFVHQYHPDHDNRDARPDGTNTPKGNADESYTVTRACTFTFTTTPPPGFGSTGWGSSAIGGNYSEKLTGLSRHPVTVSGTFVLRRVSELGTITINP